MKQKIDLSPKHLELVKNILGKFKITAYVFGSRAKSSAKKLSDLDLCLKGDYDKSTIRKLKDEFEESDLPFKVDVVVWSDLTDTFKKNIENDLLKLF